MMGRHHTRVALMSGAAVASTGWSIDHHQLLPRSIWDPVVNWALPSFDGSSLGWMMRIGFAVVCACALWIGGVLPDIDSAKSTLGRFIHVPVRHRGWTHSDWFIAAIFFVTLIDPTHITPWLLIGVISHDVVDELSYAGRVHTYPIGRYKVIDQHGTECVVKHRWNGLYSTGRDSRSEKATYRWVMMMLAVITAVSLYTVLSYQGCDTSNFRQCVNSYVSH